jgi:hypothetical protein
LFISASVVILFGIVPATLVGMLIGGSIAFILQRLGQRATVRLAAIIGLILVGPVVIFILGRTVLLMPPEDLLVAGCFWVVPGVICLAASTIIGVKLYERIQTRRVIHKKVAEKRRRNWLVPTLLVGGIAMIGSAVVFLMTLTDPPNLVNYAWSGMSMLVGVAVICMGVVEARSDQA